MSKNKRHSEQNGAEARTASEGSLSERGIREEDQSVMLENVTGGLNTSDTSGRMTKAEALAVLWTGLEALAMLGEAEIHKSDDKKLVLAILHGVDFDPANGLVQR